MAKGTTANQNGAGKKSSKNSAPSTGTSTPVTSSATPTVAVDEHHFGHGKPDKAIYDAEQEKIKAEIDVVQKKLVSLSDACPSRKPVFLF